MTTTADAMIRSWRIARLSSDTGSLGYPKINIIARCALYGGGVGTPVYSSSFLPMQGNEDADFVQKIVLKMPMELKETFEAKHLSIIQGKKTVRMPHKERAKQLGISKSTYWKRLDSATKYVSDWIEWDLTASDHFGNISSELKLTLRPTR